MRNLFVFFLSAWLLSGCSYFKKHPDESQSAAASDSAVTKTAETKEHVVRLDTIILLGKLCRLDSISKGEYESVTSYLERNKKSELVNTSGSQSESEDTAHVKEFKEGIRFTVKGGDTFWLKNNIHYADDNDTSMGYTESYTKFEFIGNCIHTNYWIVQANYYESIGHFLVNKRTDSLTGTIGSPVLSPDFQFFASGNYDLSGESIIGFDLYKIVKDSLVTVFSRETSWGPLEVKWKDNHTLYLKQEYTDDYSNSTVRYAKLDLNQLDLNN